MSNINKESDECFSVGDGRGSACRNRRLAVLPVRHIQGFTGHRGRAGRDKSFVVGYRCGTDRVLRQLLGVLSFPALRQG